MNAFAHMQLYYRMNCILSRKKQNKFKMSCKNESFKMENCKNGIDKKKTEMYNRKGKGKGVFHVSGMKGAFFVIKTYIGVL